MSIIKTANCQIDKVLETPPLKGDFSKALLSSASDLEVRERFVKFAKNLKTIAPKANDFTYFSAVMLHSAEANLIDDNGNIKKDTNGNDITAEWKIDPKTGSWKWVCSDPNVKAYKNNNGDIFPEVELKKAYRKWVGRPLCKDHKSSSVDGIRGIIVDTYYDDKFKRVIGLCALDKVNYPDLARKVETGYANNVSMGTAVGVSICYNCGNRASVEADYCSCVRSRSTYGEINIDLSPIELSLVVTGADPKAKLRHVIASLNQYSDEKKARIDELKRAGCVTPGELLRLEGEIDELRKSVSSLLSLQKEAAVNPEKIEQARNLGEVLKTVTDSEVRSSIEKRIKELVGDDEEETVIPPYGMAGNAAMTGGSDLAGRDMESSGPPEYAMEGRNVSLGSDFSIEIKGIHNKLGAMEEALRDLAKSVQINTTKEGQMSNAKLLERARARRAMSKTAYHQGGGGVNDPQTYPVDPTNDSLKTKGDKQMEGTPMETGKDGLHPGDLELKKKLLRAELEERKLKRHALMANAEVTVGKTPDGKSVAVNKDTGKAQVVNVAEDMPKEFPVKSSYDGTVIDSPAELAAYKRYLDQMGVDGAVHFNPVKKAYLQGGGGVNDPQTYPVDPTNDNLKTKGDKQMEGTPMETGKDGLYPGDLELKKKLLRASFTLAKVAGKTDRAKSKWTIYAGSDKVLEASGADAWGDELDENWATFASENYGREVIRTIRTEGLGKTAYLLTGIEKTAADPLPPMPGMPAVPPVKAPLVPAAPTGDVGGEEGEDPIDNALKALTDHLQETEKALGDLKDTLQEKSGKTEADLPSTAEVEANDHVNDVVAALNDSADELALVSVALEARREAGKTIGDTAVDELLRMSKSAAEDNVSFREQASEIIAEAAKKKQKKEKDEEVEEKEEKKGKKDKKEDKKGKKGKEVDEEEGEECEEEEEKEEKKGKKSKAEVMLENLLRARASARRDIARTAAGDNLEEEIRKLREDVDALLKAERAEKDSEGDEAHPDLASDGGDIEVVEEMNGNDGETDALDEQLAQLLDECEVDEKEETEMHEPKTAAERRAWREKVAAEAAGKYEGKKLDLSPAVTKETNMPLGNTVDLGQLSIKTDEAKVEGIEDQYNKIMDQVKHLPKVREAVNHVYKLMRVGALSVADFGNAEKLEVLAVDPAAAKYWKQYFGAGDKESSAFGTELVKEFSHKKAQLGLDEQRARLRRAYDVAVEMQGKEMIDGDVDSLHRQADAIASLDDKSFEAMKSALARVTAPRKVKTATPALQVGVSHEDTQLETASSLVDQLKRMW